MPSDVIVDRDMLGPGSPSSPDVDYGVLVERIAQHSPAAEERLARIFEWRVTAMVRGRVRDRDAVGEVVNDVLMRAIVALRRRQLHDAAKLARFICGITRNSVNSYLRARCERPNEVPLEDRHAAPGDLERDLGRRLLIQSVSRALRALNSTDRVILSRTLVEGWKPSEVASSLGLSSSVVRTRKSRALRKVADMLTAGCD